MHICCILTYFLLLKIWPFSYIYKAVRLQVLKRFSNSIKIYSKNGMLTILIFNILNIIKNETQIKNHGITICYNWT